MDVRRQGSVDSPDREPSYYEVMAAPRPHEVALRESREFALREAGDYFARRGRLLETLRRLAGRLDAEGVPYAIVGGLALFEHSYVHMTDDVDLLVTTVGLKRIYERLVGLGYLATQPDATRAIRDIRSGVRVKLFLTGEFPGDGKPKRVAFPDPIEASDEVQGLRVLRLPRLIELKLASGMTAPQRLRDLADVQEIIKVRQLDGSFAEQLDASVRERYRELQKAVAAASAS